MITPAAEEIEQQFQQAIRERSHTDADGAIPQETLRQKDRVAGKSGEWQFAHRRGYRNAGSSQVPRTDGENGSQDLNRLSTEKLCHM